MDLLQVHWTTPFDSSIMDFHQVNLSQPTYSPNGRIKARPSGEHISNPFTPYDDAIKAQLEKDVPVDNT